MVKMSPQDIIEKVKNNTIEYHINGIRLEDVMNFMDYLTNQLYPYSKKEKAKGYEAVIYSHIYDSMQWYSDTEDEAYLDSARELLFKLIEQYVEEKIL
ncbi:hypothetical protein [Staphylococcus pseudoxylosus]|uniref:hypothetical protein n=1 Tax=Staphylococcus pseudoxylosus TaxID=2282419 RepID=UPI002DBDC61A|nr:hypothetical protein [Staphylococcus pseudoxylosus]MEB6038193.1 hypothetical protein [Staphylococcus pseudoxylosus]